MAKEVSLEKFVEDCRLISDLTTRYGKRENLPYPCARGLRSGVKIIRDVITYFSGDANPRNREEDTSVLRTAEFGLQTLRDSCEIAEEDYGIGALKNLRSLINAVGEYSIKAGDLQYSFSRVVVSLPEAIASQARN